MKATKAVKGILKLIEEKNLTKVTDLAKNLNMSPAGMHGHLQRLLKNNVLEKSYGINYSALGFIQVLFMVEFFYPADTGFIETINKYGNVKKIVECSGDFDYLIYTVFENEDQMKDFLTSTLMHSSKIRNYSTVVLDRGVHI